MIIVLQKWMTTKQTSWAADGERESLVHRILSAGTNPALNMAAVSLIKLLLFFYKETNKGNMEKKGLGGGTGTEYCLKEKNWV